MLDVNAEWTARIAELNEVIKNQQDLIAVALGVLAALGFDMLDFIDYPL